MGNVLDDHAWKAKMNRAEQLQKNPTNSSCSEEAKKAVVCVGQGILQPMLNKSSLIKNNYIKQNVAICKKTNKHSI